VIQALQDRKAYKDSPAIQDLQAHKVLLDHRDHKAYRDSLVKQDPQDHRVKQDLQDYKVK
jgi:hypothetical protein